MLTKEEVKAVFNDLQIILSCDGTLESNALQLSRKNEVKEDVIQLRNLMNMTQSLVVVNDCKST